jgi:hypothetical protein
MHPDWTPSLPPMRILGITLRDPVCLGHVALLAELENPVVVGGDMLPGDVAQCVFVLMSSPSDARKAVRSRFSPLLFRVWASFNDVSDWNAVIEQFAEWFSEQTATPNRIFTMSTGSQRKDIAAPWWVNQIAMVMGELHVSYTDALNMPCRTAGQLVAALMEARNQAEYESEQRRQFIEQVRSMTTGEVSG